MSKILFAGPFVGEFGYELFMYQGYIRKLANDYDETIISSRTANEFLYKDFCNKFVPYEPKTNNCDSFWCIDQNITPNIYDNYECTKVIKVIDFQSFYQNFKNIEQQFISYRNNKLNDMEIDVCICARSV